MGLGWALWGGDGTLVTGMGPEWDRTKEGGKKRKGTGPGRDGNGMRQTATGWDGVGGAGLDRMGWDSQDRAGWERM